MSLTGVELLALPGNEAGVVGVAALAVRHGAGVALFHVAEFCLLAVHAVGLPLWRAATEPL